MEQDTSAKIAVIIPHYNDNERLNRCLTALLQNDGVKDAEIIVVDNDSDQDISNLALDFTFVRFVKESTRGAAAARNRGVIETCAPLLFFLDSDCVPDPDWIRAGRTALLNADIIGGAIRVFDETPPPRSGAQAFEAIFAFNQKHYVEKSGFSVTANLLTWRHVFQKVGGFRPRVSEDVDWCHRARSVGFSLIFDPRVKVSHPSRSNMPELSRKWRRLVRESYELEAQQRFARIRWAGQAFLVLCSPTRDIFRILFSSQLRGSREMSRGVMTLFQIRALRAAWMIHQVLRGRH